MKFLPLSICLALQSPLLAADQIVTLGDSLSFAYEGEFGFQLNIPLVGPYGDAMPATVRNWVEILGSNDYRNAHFDQGTRNDITFTFPFSNPQTIFFRKDYNWAIPGLKIDELRRFMVEGDTFLELLSESEDFGLLASALGYSNFNQAEDFNVLDLDQQIGSTAERLVLFIGGNDVRQEYGSIYAGNPAGTFVDEFISDANAILTRVRELNADIEIVVVAVPHIGITPDIKSGYPTDAVATPRVTAVLQELNQRLKQAATQHGAGFADIFSPTLSLLEAGPYGIHGIAFNNTGSASGNLNDIWLDGTLSANFHPNTNAQAVIANIIVDAFNKRYQTGIAQLSATEILGGLLGKNAAQIDMPFASWMTGFGLTGGLENSDADGDGVPAGVEFALGLNPSIKDADQIQSGLTADGSRYQLAYPQRLPSSPNYTLEARSSATLAAPFDTLSPVPEAGTDGLFRASIPTGGAKGFLRLETTVAP